MAGIIKLAERNNDSFPALKKKYLRYYLSSAGCLYLCMYVCYCDCSHTVQPTALKLWHNIPYVNI